MTTRLHRTASSLQNYLRDHFMFSLTPTNYSLAFVMGKSATPIRKEHLKMLGRVTRCMPRSMKVELTFHFQVTDLSRLHSRNIKYGLCTK